ncbi:MAG: dTDP-4-dehydrorhamnose reductase [bacterium]|nr:dTDP-4-dehydrorhamnose reductase [bacterium]
MLKILLTGGKGMLGRTLCAELSMYEVIPTDLPEADITDANGMMALLEKYQPDVVIHCAAMTAVDACESSVDMAYRLNAVGTANVARACHHHNIRLIAISTDYVFEGDATRPYNEFDLPSGGRTIYGKSKYAGEQAVRQYCPNHIIARISWLYGAGGPSFVHAMVNLADGSRPVLKVVADQIGNPTSTSAVAKALHEILERPELVGTYHLTCEGEASWCDFAKAIFEELGIQQTVEPCATEDFPRPAPRPKNSRLDKMMLRLNGLSPMPQWREALRQFISLEFQKRS